MLPSFPDVMKIGGGIAVRLRILKSLGKEMNYSIRVISGEPYDNLLGQPNIN